ncbi:MAG: 50S ribosomal protein L6 [Anaerolineae bacterium]|nr:50S ribosomal protein L6 [Caldilineales bacterium]MDW8268332.1 50S ribosomal protein L6 [Anaerolineae bacterium]
MSRIGKKPIPLPKNVTVEVDKNNTVTVKGPKGTLSRTLPADMRIELRDGQLLVSRPTDQRHHRALHGLTRSLLNNMVIGVSSGFSKELELVGVGYKAAMVGKELELSLGYSHPIRVAPPPTITFEVDKSNRIITVRGIDKELVGLEAAKLRALRKPEPYKGKGVRYRGEVIRMKAGKSSKGKGKK